MTASFFKAVIQARRSIEQFGLKADITPKRKKPPHLWSGFCIHLKAKWRLRGQCFLCLCNNRTKRFWFVYGQISQNLTVDFDAGHVQTIDET